MIFLSKYAVDLSMLNAYGGFVMVIGVLFGVYLMWVICSRHEANKYSYARTFSGAWDTVDLGPVSLGIFIGLLAVLFSSILWEDVEEFVARTYSKTELNVENKFHIFGGKVVDGESFEQIKYFSSNNPARQVVIGEIENNKTGEKMLLAASPAYWVKHMGYTQQEIRQYLNDRFNGLMPPIETDPPLFYED
jgi:hypothetical protein